MRRVGVLWVSLGITVLFPAAASGQEGFRLNNYAPPFSVGDGLSRPLPDTLGPWAWSVQIGADWSQVPLVLEGDPDIEVVRTQMTGHLVAALGIGPRLEVGLAVPMLLDQSQDDDVPAALGGLDSSAMGDPSLGVSYFLLGEKAEGFQLGATAAVSLPLGSAADLTSDDGLGARGEVTAALASKYLTASVGAGFAYRPSRDYESVRVGSQILYDGGVYLTPLPQLRIMGEVFGASGLRSGQKNGSNLIEALVGVRTTLQSGLTFAFGATQGLTSAATVPDSRALVFIGWGPPLPAEEAPPPRPAPPSDRDADGILDDHDACPDQPEDLDHFEDGDGCPDPDNDRDGVPDGSDQCPNEAEDADQHQDEDGCPDPDNDADGILDAADRCPNEAETVNGVEDEDGCPDTAQIVGNQIQINQRIEFDTDSDVLQESSNTVLESVAQILRQNPGITKVRIEGHTDNRGSARHNQQLSARRARSVLTWLTAHGVEASRLQSAGVGSSRPIAPNTTPEGQQTNRRVEFHILEGAASPPPGQGAPAPAP